MTLVAAGNKRIKTGTRTIQLILSFLFIRTFTLGTLHLVIERGSTTLTYNPHHGRFALWGLLNAYDPSADSNLHKTYHLGLNCEGSEWNDLSL
jgi:hypothetical protein